MKTRLEKIRALAADHRGDPATRAIAKAKLEALKPKDTRVPGLRPSDQWWKWRFMTLERWIDKKGNYSLNHDGVRLVLKLKRGLWVVSIDGEDQEPRVDVREALEDAWTRLLTL